MTVNLKCFLYNLKRPKPKKWYHFALCESAIKLIDEMCERYPDTEYIFPDVCYEMKLVKWHEKEKAGELTDLSVKPKPFMPTAILANSLVRYYKRMNMVKFTARDFRRTFKTQGAEIGISKEVPDLIQQHIKSDISSKYYDNFEYFDKKWRAF